MKRFLLISFVFYLSNFLVSDEKKIEDLVGGTSSGGNERGGSAD